MYTTAQVAVDLKEGKSENLGSSDQAFQFLPHIELPAFLHLYSIALLLQRDGHAVHVVV